MERILIIGSGGQIGTELSHLLRKKHGAESVITSDKVMHNAPQHEEFFEPLDVLNTERLHTLIKHYNVKKIYHLAAILSAMGEQKPLIGWEINMQGLINVLEAAKIHHVQQVFWPSSIAVFGPTTPKHKTPQHCYTDPMTLYGISKLAGERWIEYYNTKYHLDVRSLRYPGIIGPNPLPIGGGTTDYAVDMYRSACRKKSYTCYLKANTSLPMMYMPDVLRATLELMDADEDPLSLKTSYNLAGISLSPQQLTQEIQTHCPKFQVHYKPDTRQSIAEKWPSSINDQDAENDWGWKLEYNLPLMTKHILHQIKTSSPSKKIKKHASMA